MAYSQPTDLTEALSILERSKPQIVAGGTDVYPSMQQGRRAEAFLDVTRISGFAEINETDDGFRLGAAVTWSDVLNAPLPPAFDALKQAAREVGSVQIQNAGTIAGNLCNASPAADGVPPLLALDASIELAGPEGTRLIPLDRFITGVRQTVLANDKLVTALVIPSPPNGMVSAFEKLGSRRYLVISIAMTAVNLTLDTTGRIDDARIAVGACSAVAQRLPGLERDLVGKQPTEFEITPEHLAPLSPIDDVRGSIEYRWEAAAEQIYRTVSKAVPS